MRHLDRSNGQSHRPLRSGETPAFRFCPCRGCAQFSTEIFQKSGMFSAPEKHPSKHHNLPAIHHNFTTKNHHETTRFLKNPMKKRHSTTPKKNPKTTSSP